MGQMYAELFPDHFRAVVNDGNMDHSLGTVAFQLTEASFAEDSYDQFVAWCNRSANCSLHGQDVRALYAGLLAKADDGTLVDPSDGHTVSSWELLDITQFFFSRPRWTQLADLIGSLSTGTASAGGRAARTAFSAERAPMVKADLVEDVRAQCVHPRRGRRLPARGDGAAGGDELRGERPGSHDRRGGLAGLVT